MISILFQRHGFKPRQSISMGLITPSSNQSGGRAVPTMTSSKLLNLIFEVWEVKTIYRQIIYTSTDTGTQTHMHAELARWAWCILVKTDFWLPDTNFHQVNTNCQVSFASWTNVDFKKECNSKTQYIYKFWQGGSTYLIWCLLLGRESRVGWLINSD